MADLLTHVLIIYIILKIMSMKTNYIKKEHIPIGMIGAILPDLSRIQHIIPPEHIQQLLGTPYSWWGLHTLIGTTITALLITYLFDKKHRKKIFTLLIIGAISHLILDYYLLKPTPSQYWGFYPLIIDRPTNMLYLSTDITPAIITTTTAITIKIIETINKKPNPKPKPTLNTTKK
ncbi:metal-dependent hydrolase [Methanonatronarchaeum sp. AMET-Sl]|uniref:metal-dependent hydrolase n=1 Tax=Methanonatronarchaeum sp. AMET-Sl TaxID=3037654 RepID=UPI00244DAF6A|nr:metal-dependent hydrolase [Methanonatronarchaeum sp. AMET-Sl]WGI17682.1 metal-dependent hydrolase [Methanonatronarchaeum sp. AMET-Sl]